MKNPGFLQRLPRIHCLAGLLTMLATSGLAQPSGPTNYNYLPVVTIRATDPLASWTGDPGAFTVFRAGNTNLALNVFYQIGGTASNGVDYALISNWVFIPAGSVSNSIAINPIDHGKAGAETVILTLAPSPTMNPVNYSIGSPSNAAVYITRTAATNIPPSVSLVSPKNGAIFYSPTNISLVAKAGDADGSVSNVEFFAGTVDLGKGNLVVLDPPGIDGVVGLVYLLTWQNAPAGTYSMTAVATDNAGTSTRAAAVGIAVLPGPPTNLPPVARITAPANGAIFHAPVDVPIYTYAHDLDDAIASVEIFAGSNSIGFAHPVPCLTNSPCLSCPTRVCPTNIYLLVWSNAPLGSFALTANATDTRGAATLSDAVNIAILPSPPPPTNRPPIVNIIATDPVAIEGTNCWPWRGITNSQPTWSNWLSGTIAERYYTNCGPKNASFAVHRFGVTNNALTVSYVIAGTASNGVDYVPLPGLVTIPAGSRSAAIPVVPIDDGPPDINSTVILKLVPDTNYVLGFPLQAAAIILDSNSPRPVTGVLPDRCFHVSATGPDGAWFHVEYSSDNSHWNPICTNQVVQGSIDFIDADAPADQARFYRAVPENDAPVQ